ncbi:HlyD family secretion protein [Solitalea sp. MAHUQ-68]|uniref:HlyD family secretion protein n=1 Tax=Solitalea agri TaxID=2953739 RepID=A0A9X2F2J7_9SPHI|nr:HlyD family secretion protein [Solitalea agri]MCO4293534.1 HlyD family secretion protein [Solitalea agri]
MNNKIFPVEIIDFTSELWLPQLKIKSLIIYNSILAFILTVLLLLPFIRVDISIKSGGIVRVRPITEKYEVKPLNAGSISQIYVYDGMKVLKGQTLLILDRESNKSKLSENELSLQEHLHYDEDLKLLISIDLKSEIPLNQLVSPLFKQQFSKFRYSFLEQQAIFEKAQSNYEMNKKLFDQKVIALKEFRDYNFEFNKAKAALQAFVEQQRSIWQEEKTNNTLALTRLKAEQNELEKDWGQTEIMALISRTFQQFTGKYEGGQIQKGETICHKRL